MNNPGHIFASLETIFWVKILKIFDADPGSGMEKIRIGDKRPGSATLAYLYLFAKQSTFYFHFTIQAPSTRFKNVLNS
jgi:hypothetical protein